MIESGRQSGIVHQHIDFQECLHLLCHLPWFLTSKLRDNTSASVLSLISLSIVISNSSLRPVIITSYPLAASSCCPSNPCRCSGYNAIIFNIVLVEAKVINYFLTIFVLKRKDKVIYLLICIQLCLEIN